MSLWAFLLGGAFVSALPFDRIIPFLYWRSREVSQKLDKTRFSRIRMSKMPFIEAVVLLCHFLKGYGLMLAQYTFFDEPWVLMVSVFLLLVLHNRSPFLLFRHESGLWMVFWGIYSFMDPLLLVVYPVVMLAGVLLLNSFVLATFVTVLSFFVFIWFMQLNLVYFFLNFLLFLVTFGVMGKRLFSHFEDRPLTVLDAFERRV